MDCVGTPTCTHLCTQVVYTHLWVLHNSHQGRKSLLCQVSEATVHVGSRVTLIADKAKFQAAFSSIRYGAVMVQGSCSDGAVVVQ